MRARDLAVFLMFVFFNKNNSGRPGADFFFLVPWNGAEASSRPRVPRGAAELQSCVTMEHDYSYK